MPNRNDEAATTIVWVGAGLTTTCSARSRLD
jgi:hypothetical protein